MKVELNEIDFAFKDYIQKVRPPDNNVEWFKYLEKVFTAAFVLGSEFTLKTIQEEFEKAQKEEEKNATNR